MWKGIRFISVRFEGGEGTGKATEMGMALGYGAEGGGGGSDGYRSVMEAGTSAWTSGGLTKGNVSRHILVWRGGSVCR